jgi:hypothetical protein
VRRRWRGAARSCCWASTGPCRVGGGSEGPAYEPEGPFTLVPALEVNWGYAKAKAEVAAFLRRSALVYELPFAESAAQQSAQLDREKDLLLGALDGKVGDENDESRVFEC